MHSMLPVSTKRCRCQPCTTCWPIMASSGSGSYRRKATPEYELELSVFEPYHNGAGGYWCSEPMDWVIYASHEESITIGGEWLIEAIKRAWPGLDVIHLLGFWVLVMSNDQLGYPPVHCSIATRGLEDARLQVQAHQERIPSQPASRLVTSPESAGSFSY